MTDPAPRNLFSVMKPVHVLEIIKAKITASAQAEYLKNLVLEMYGPSSERDEMYAKLKEELKASKNVEANFHLFNFWESEFLRLRMKEGDLLLDPTAEIEGPPGVFETFYKDLHILKDEILLREREGNEGEEGKGGDGGEEGGDQFSTVCPSTGFFQIEKKVNFPFKILRSDVSVNFDNGIDIFIEKRPFTPVMITDFFQKENVLQVHCLQPSERYLILTEKGFYSVVISGTKYDLTLLLETKQLTGEIVGGPGDVFIVKGKKMGDGKGSLMLFDYKNLTLERLMTISVDYKVRFHPEAEIVSILEPTGDLFFCFVGKENQYCCATPPEKCSFVTEVVFADKNLSSFVAFQDQNTLRWKKLVKDVLTPTEPLSEEEVEHLQPFSSSSSSSSLSHPPTNLKLKPAKIAVLKDLSTFALMQHVE